MRYAITSAVVTCKLQFAPALTENTSEGRDVRISTRDLLSTSGDLCENPGQFEICVIVQS